MRGNDDVLDLLVLLWLRRRRKLQREQRRKAARWWVRPVLTRRRDQGAFENLVAELRQDPELFHNYHRMSMELFDELLIRVSPHIEKMNAIREAISPGSRLSLTLRYLASGDSMVSLHYQYRIGRSTVSKIISETTEAIWNVLQPQVLPQLGQEEWSRIAKDFEGHWHFPNCIGSIDGKHVVIQKYDNTGSAYYNYKGTFSIVLLAVCDAQLRFTYVNIGQPGRESDSGIFQDSELGKAIKSKELPLPLPGTLPGTNIRVPHVFVGDAAFPLMENLMRPYPGNNLPPEQVIFNYRMSRARIVIENAFGVLAARMRILRKPIVASPDAVKSIVKSCVVLHNWLRDNEMQVPPNGRRYIPINFVDREDRLGNVERGEWREEDDGLRGGGLRNLARNVVRNATTAAKNVRLLYTDYFMNEGRISWQWYKLPHFQREQYMH